MTTATSAKTSLQNITGNFALSQLFYDYLYSISLVHAAEYRRSIPNRPGENGLKETQKMNDSSLYASVFVKT